jgi:hypothetical protein
VQVALQGDPKGVTGPFLAPAIARGDPAVRHAARGYIGYRTEVRTRCAPKNFEALSGPAAAGREIECLDHAAVMREHAPPRLADRGPALRRLRIHAAVCLVGHGGVQIETLRPPAAYVAERVSAGDHRLRPQRGLLGGVAPSHLRRDHAEEVRLHAQPIHDRQSRSVAENLGLPPIWLSVHSEGSSRVGSHERHGIERTRRPTARTGEAEPVSCNLHLPCLAGRNGDDASAVGLIYSDRLRRPQTG